jgi:cell wall-active antibiotic response 4TMS protein YvqF
MNGRTWHTGPVVWGLIFIVLGVLFLLEQLDVFDLRAAYILPVVLIVIGVTVLVGGTLTRPRSE